MNEPRYTLTPVNCGHCHNHGVMVLAKSYSQMTQDDHPQTGEPFEGGSIFDLLECPVCHGITLRKYFWNDWMESEADVTYHILYPSKADYQGSKEMLFPPNSQHDAYLEIRGIMQKARASLTILDPHLDETIFRLLATLEARLQVRILTSKIHSKDFESEARKFQQQYSNISLEVRKSREFHDRFILLDQSQCYHLGASIKDAGRTVFMLKSIQDAETKKALLEVQTRSWEKGSAVDF